MQNIKQNGFIQIYISLVLIITIIIMVGATSIVLYNQNKLTPSTASIAEVLKQIEADRNVEKIKEKKTRIGIK
ncbi:MAG: hypothetical protein U9Q96_02940 [Patescibacteria group bacterium]|nr:hypothetical protein [Patescibacteria group bacterium]